MNKSLEITQGFSNSKLFISLFLMNNKNTIPNVEQHNN